MNQPTRSKAQPRCIIIAGPNGAGKTTFAREFLPKEAGVVHFVNADVIRRIARSRELFPAYCALADAWAVYDNTGPKPVLVEKSP